MDTNQPVKELSKDEREQLDLFVESQLKITSDTFEKSTAYTNLLLVAGYAGFFALWQITREFLGKRQVIASALLMLTSIIIFMIYEIYRSLIAGAYLHSYFQRISTSEAKASFANMVRTVEDFKSERRAAALHGIVTWAVIFSLTTITGVSAAVILLYAFIHALFQG